MMKFKFLAFLLLALSMLWAGDYWYNYENPAEIAGFFYPTLAVSYNAISIDKDFSKENFESNLTFYLPSRKRRCYI